MAPSTRLPFSLLWLYQGEGTEVVGTGARGVTSPCLSKDHSIPWRKPFLLSFEVFIPRELQVGGGWRCSFAPWLIFLLSSALPAWAKPAGGVSFSACCDCADVPVTSSGKDGSACLWVLWVGWAGALSPRPPRGKCQGKGTQGTVWGGGPGRVTLEQDESRSMERWGGWHHMG